MVFRLCPTNKSVEIIDSSQETEDQGPQVIENLALPVSSLHPESPISDSPIQIDNPNSPNDASHLNFNLDSPSSISSFSEPTSSRSNSLDAENVLSNSNIQSSIRSVSFVQMNSLAQSPSSTNTVNTFSDINSSMNISYQPKTNSTDFNNDKDLLNKDPYDKKVFNFNYNSFVNGPLAPESIDIDSIELHLNSCKVMIDELPAQLRYSYLESVVNNILNFAQSSGVEFSMDIKAQVLSFIEIVVNENLFLGDLLLVYTPLFHVPLYDQSR